MNDRNLDLFGKLLVSEVRDESIEKFNMIKLGRIKSDAARTLTEKLSKFSVEDLEVIDEVVLSSIDNVIHNFLWMLDRNDEVLEVRVIGEMPSDSIASISDGLPGELYSEDGWITKYSKYDQL